jgi:hypothetical protein
MRDKGKKRADWFRKNKSKNPKTARTIVMALGTIPLAVVHHAFAGTRYYVGPGSGAGADWNNSANWSATSGGGGGASVPVSGDDVFIQGSTPTFVSFDGNYPSGALDSLTVNATGLNDEELVQSANNLATESLILGTTYLNGAVNQYVVDGTAALTVNGPEIIGQNGHGEFYQGVAIAGGTHTIQDSTGNGLELGQNTNSYGVYTLDSGSLNVNGASNFEIVGNSGSGEFDQSGGTNASGTLFVGYQNNSNGTYSLSSTGNATFNTAYVGGTTSTAATGGVDNLSIQGGTMTVTGTLKIWDKATTHVSLSGGALSVGALDTSDKPSVFWNNWTSGTLSLTNPTSGFLSTDPYDSAPFPNLPTSVTLGSGQYLSAAAGEFMYFTTGLFSQTGGVNSTSTLFVGAEGNYTYSLSGSASLSVSGNEQLGGSGQGTFTQQGGSNTAGSIRIASFNSVYNLQSGNVSSGTEMIEGFPDNATFNQTGGTNTITSTGDALDIAPALGSPGGPYSSAGEYALSGGSLTVDGSVYVGSGNPSTAVPGILTVSNTGQMTVDGSLNVYSGSVIDLAGGSISTAALNTSGTPSLFDWTGGTLAITGSAGLTFNSSGPLGASVTLSSSQTLDVLTTEFIGDSGPGTVTQSGGIANIGNNTGSVGFLQIGTGASSTGIYNLSSGTLSCFGSETVGFSGIGTFAQTGGTNVISSSIAVAAFYVGEGASANGLYTLGPSGSLQVTNGEEDIGYNGIGTFNQSGGTNLIGSGWSLNLGYNPGSSGIYNLSGGSVQFNYFTSGVYVGGSSLGSGGGADLSISGAATMTIPGTLEIYSGGLLVQNGGTLSAGNTVNLDQIDVNAGSATLGAVTGSGSLSVGRSSVSTATVTASGLNQSSVTIQNTGLLTINGGSANSVKTLIINGNGTLDLTNHHLFINYGSGFDPVATIRSYLTNGYAGGKWNGPGVDSSSAALPANSHYGLGYADGADGIVAGLSSGQIEVMYTLYGDANLDGVVNGSDFTILAGSLGKSVTAWDKGDFNYDGVVNATDFTLLVGNLGKSASGAAVELSASDYTAIDAFAAANGLMADVPEPASESLAIVVGTGLLFRRSRKTRLP